METSQMLDWSVGLGMLDWECCVRDFAFNHGIGVLGWGTDISIFRPTVSNVFITKV